MQPREGPGLQAALSQGREAEKASETGPVLRAKGWAFWVGWPVCYSLAFIVSHLFVSFLHSFLILSPLIFLFLTDLSFTHLQMKPLDSGLEGTSLVEPCHLLILVTPHSFPPSSFPSLNWALGTHWGPSPDLRCYFGNLS